MHLQISQRRKATRVVWACVRAPIYVPVCLGGSEIRVARGFSLCDFPQTSPSTQDAWSGEGLEATYTTVPAVYLEKLKLGH